MANCITEIEISDYCEDNQVEYDPKLSDFSVNFIQESVDRIIVSLPGFVDDYVLDRNVQTINESTTMLFNPNNNLTRLKIEFCLEYCLRLGKELSQEVIHRLKTYVDYNPRPTNLIVYISRVLEYEQVLSLLLKRIKVEEIKGFKEDEDCCCPICLVNFGERKDAMVTSMPCNHAFHDDCILAWFNKCQSFATCPICRYQLGEKDLA